MGSDSTWSCKIYLPFKQCTVKDSIRYDDFHPDRYGPLRSFTADKGRLKCSTSVNQDMRDHLTRNLLTIECKSDHYRGTLYFIACEVPYVLTIIDVGTYTVNVPFCDDGPQRYDRYDESVILRQIKYCK